MKVFLTEEQEKLVTYWVEVLKKVAAPYILNDPDTLQDFVRSEVYNKAINRGYRQINAQEMANRAATAVSNQ